MYTYELAALCAATCWAITGLVSTGPARHLGALAFNRVRMVLVFAMLSCYVALTNGWDSIVSENVIPLLLSGLIGIFLGDTALFLTLNRLGPRRTAMIFSLNAPISVVLGWIVLGESLSQVQILGIIVTFSGVLLAIRFGKRKSQLHQWEDIQGPLWIGVGLGLIAATSQSIGSLIARPVMETGIDPFAASTLRIGIAAFCLVLLGFYPSEKLKARSPLTPKISLVIAFSGLLGMGIGMTLILFALSGGEVGIVATLSATTPAILLPLLWWQTKEMPALAAWAGAILVVIGSALLFKA